MFMYVVRSRLSQIDEISYLMQSSASTSPPCAASRQIKGIGMLAVASSHRVSCKASTVKYISRLFLVEYVSRIDVMYEIYCLHWIFFSCLIVKDWHPFSSDLVAALKQ